MSRVEASVAGILIFFFLPLPHNEKNLVSKGNIVLENFEEEFHYSATILSLSKISLK